MVLTGGAPAKLGGEDLEVAVEVCAARLRRKVVLGALLIC